MLCQVNHEPGKHFRRGTTFNIFIHNGTHSDCSRFLLIEAIILAEETSLQIKLQVNVYKCLSRGTVIGYESDSLTGGAHLPTIYTYKYLVVLVEKWAVWCDYECTQLDAHMVEFWLVVKPEKRILLYAFLSLEA